MKFLKTKLPLILLLTIALVSCSTDTDSIETNEELSSIEKEVKPLAPLEINVLKSINEFRVLNGLNELEEMNLIRPQVYSHTEYMLKEKSMSHDNWVEREYYLSKNAPAKSVSEIVAFGYNQADDVVSAWVNSESHRKTIEGDFTHFNVSAEKDERGLYYFTCIFVRKQ